MITISAEANISKGNEWSRRLPFFFNVIFLHLRIFVLLLSSAYLVSKYSQLFIAKNRARTNKKVNAISHSVEETSYIFLRTDAGSAFCFFLFLSVLLYPLHCSWRRKQVLPSRSNLRSGLSLARKACATYEMVDLTVDCTRVS